MSTEKEREYQKKYREEHKEYFREYSRFYNKNCRDKINRRRRERSTSDPEYRRRHREEQRRYLAQKKAMSGTENPTPCYPDMQNINRKTSSGKERNTSGRSG